MNLCPHSGRLGAYHDNQLPPDQQARMQRHLEGCATCSAEMAAMRKLTALLGSLPPPQASAEMMQRLRDLAGSSPLASAGRMIRAMAGVAAAILIVCTIGLTVGPRLARPASTGAIPDWEPQALAGQVAETPGSSDELVANWMVQDLSGADGHE